MTDHGQVIPGLGAGCLDLSITKHTVMMWLAAFLLIVPSGFLMFTAHATEFIQSEVFVLKMGLILAAGVNAALFHTITFRTADGWDAEDHPQSVKTGRTNDEVKQDPDRMWRSDAPAAEAEVSMLPDQVSDDAIAALEEIGNEGPWEVFDRRLKVTNLDKVLFPGDPPVTKRELLRYHARIAPWMLKPFVPLPEGVRDPFGSFRLYRISVVRDLLKESGSGPMLTQDGWAANAELLVKAARYARRVEAVALEPRYDLRTRESRIRPLASARTLFRFGWATRSRRPGITKT